MEKPVEKPVDAVVDREEALRAEGLAIAASSSSTRALLRSARAIAKLIALERESLLVSADEVWIEMRRRGYSTDLGNAWGSLFSGREWEPTGRFVRSRRPAARRRRIQLWRLRGSR